MDCSRLWTRCRGSEFQTRRDPGVSVSQWVHWATAHTLVRMRDFRDPHMGEARHSGAQGNLLEVRTGLFDEKTPGSAL